MSSHVLVLRAFSGLVPGQVLDATDWRHTRSLEEDRYIKPIDSGDVESRKDCPCGITYLPAARLHDCEVLQKARAEKVAQKKAAAQSAQSAQSAQKTPTTTGS